MPFRPEQKVTLHSAAVADANGQEIECQAISSIGIQISGTVTTATIYFEGTINGTDWVALTATNVATGAVATSATAAGIWNVPVGAVEKFRARLDWSAGSVTVTSRLNKASGALPYSKVVA